MTVLVALVANALIAVGQVRPGGSVTGSASMVAEAAHSWADTGNEVFLLLAERRGARPGTPSIPGGSRAGPRTSGPWSQPSGCSPPAQWSRCLARSHRRVHRCGGGNALHDQLHRSGHRIRPRRNFVHPGHPSGARRGPSPGGSAPCTSSARRRTPPCGRCSSRTSPPSPACCWRAQEWGCTSSPATPCTTRSAPSPSASCSAFVAVFLMRRNMDYLMGEPLSPDLRARVLGASAGAPGHRPGHLPPRGVRRAEQAVRGGRRRLARRRRRVDPGAPAATTRAAASRPRT